MDSNKIQCLVDKGVISQSDANAIISFSGLPQGTSELLTILVALAINNNSSSSVSGPVIGTQSIGPVNFSTPTALTVPAGASKAVITPFVNSAVFRTDGGDPTTTAGHFLAQGSNMILTELNNFRFIAASATYDTTLFVTYY